MLTVVLTVFLLIDGKPDSARVMGVMIDMDTCQLAGRSMTAAMNGTELVAGTNAHFTFRCEFGGRDA